MDDCGCETRTVKLVGKDEHNHTPGFCIANFLSARVWLVRVKVVAACLVSMTSTCSVSQPYTEESMCSKLSQRPSSRRTSHGELAA